MQTGQKVIHQRRPELGTGIIQALGDAGVCDVQFATARFSHIPLTQLAAVPTNDEPPAALLKSPSPQEQLNHLMRRYNIPALWHITSRDNVPNILQHGLMSRHQVQRRSQPIVDISDGEVQQRRASRVGALPHSLHDYVPLYLRVRNPMLFLRRRYNASLCLLEIAPAVTLDSEFAIADGNAACMATRFHDRLSDLRFLDWQALDQEYWNSVPDGKRKRCAEVLIYSRVTPGHILRVHAATLQTCQQLQAQGITAQYSPQLFF
ncbi:DUF4433 domain-containing protein [Halomonas sp.]|uniref:DUF4433 domain-containing protein n=1 Tax=Halomonas sp. TaxID=1486246 RepID=UPI00384E0E30